MSEPYTSAPAAVRPTFLTVLCVLSFIGGAFGLFSGFSKLASPPTAELLEETRAKMDEAAAQVGDGSPAIANMMNEAMEVAQKEAENSKPLGIAGILLSLLSLFGVWKMWNLKKQGFWFYTIATLVGLAVPLYFLGFNWVAIASVGIAGLFGLIFIILYGVNLKHMS